MTIDALPAAPSRTDPTTFSPRTDALLGALAGFVSQTNATATEINDAKANAVAAAATETKWVSGNAYTEGNTAWSPADYKVYRAKGSTSGTTDPSADSANWALISGLGDVITNAEQTLSGKTFENTILSGKITQTVYAITDAATVDIDPANGMIQTWTLGGSRTVTASNFEAADSVLLMVDDGSANDITWPSMQWVNGGAPLLATSGYTGILIFKIGSTLYGSRIGAFA